MKGKLAITILILFSFLFIGRIGGEPPVVGVSEGDWFVYDFEVFWSSTYPGAEVPEYYLELNKTEYLRIDITNVLGTEIELQATTRLENGTEWKSVYRVYVDTGDATYFGPDGWTTTSEGPFCIASNLGANDLLYPLRVNSPVINETSLRTYPDSERETNRFSTNVTNKWGYIYHFVDLRFDKTTGIFVEYHIEEVPQDSPWEKVVQQTIIKESNSWVVPEFPAVLILPLLIVSTLVVVIILRGKKMSNVDSQRAIPNN